MKPFGQNTPCAEHRLHATMPHPSTRQTFPSLFRCSCPCVSSPACPICAACGRTPFPNAVHLSMQEPEGLHRSCLGQQRGCGSPALARPCATAWDTTLGTVHSVDFAVLRGLLCACACALVRSAAAFRDHFSLVPRPLQFKLYLNVARAAAGTTASDLHVALALIRKVLSIAHPERGNLFS